MKTKLSDNIIQVRIHFGRPDSPRFRSTSKHAMDKGNVRVCSSETHGIKHSAKGRRFNSITELTDAVVKALNDQGITLHPSGETKKLYFNGK